jgi:hypothetical protein
MRRWLEMGRHRASEYVTQTRMQFDSGGTYRFVKYRQQKLRKPRLVPVARVALGTLVALGIALGALGVVAPPDTSEPVLTVTPVATTSAPETPITASETPPLPPTPEVSAPPRSHVWVSRPLPTRVWPTVTPPVVDLPKHGKHSKGNAQ